MTWHSATVSTESLASLIARIRNAGGTIAYSTPGAEGVRVTWTTASSAPDHDARPSSGQ